MRIREHMRIRIPVTAGPEHDRESCAFAGRLYQKHFPCVTERSIAAALGTQETIMVSGNGKVGLGETEIGMLDLSGLAAVDLYDRHQPVMVTEFNLTLNAAGEALFADRLEKVSEKELVLV